ncbi:MAG: hypothetical protein K1X39_07230 [Thermoflexales bacterium]|nr:hypothetical protein [Thermoflexales bacterium]
METETPTTTADLGPARPQKGRANWKLLAGIIAAVVVIGALLVLIFWALSTDPTRTANLRDIVIIVYAFASLVISLATGAILLALVWQINALIHMLRSEVQPMLTNVNTAVNSVRGTTMLVSDNIAKPTIKIASWLAGARKVGETLGAKVKRS